MYAIIGRKVRGTSYKKKIFAHGYASAMLDISIDILTE